MMLFVQFDFGSCSQFIAVHMNVPFITANSNTIYRM